MRVVSSSSVLWRAPGIASTHVAALFGCDEFGVTPLKLWADRVSLRRKIEMKRVENLGQGGADWLKWRAAGIGGSEVASICGEAGRYNDTLKIWKEKTAARRGEEIGGGFENEHMRRGKELEPIARQEYENLMGWVCPPLCAVHDEFDYIRCSFDGLRDPDGQLVLEIKAPAAKNHAKAIDVRERGYPDAFHELIPHYYCQVQYQLLISGAPLAHFVSYNREPQFAKGNRLVLVEVPADESYQQEILRRVRAFWEDYVIPERSPEGP